jgi:DNA-binding SARP family transcriptional activator
MLYVSLLGEQTITGDTTSDRTSSSRAVALVGFLAVHAGSPQTRQRIAGLFWPDSTDGQALTNLRRELHHLRHVLGDDPSLTVTSRDLCWCDTATCRVDVRVCDIERKATLAAAANKDDDGILAPARGLRRTGGAASRSRRPIPGRPFASSDRAQPASTAVR